MNTCANCDLEIDGTPYAFPLTDMRVDAYDRFCSEACVHAHAETLEEGSPSEGEANHSESPKGSP